MYGNQKLVYFDASVKTSHTTCLCVSGGSPTASFHTIVAYALFFSAFAVSLAKKDEAPLYLN